MKNLFFKSFLSKYGVPLILLLTLVVIQLIFSDVGLLTWENIKIVLLQSSVIALISFGLSLIMIGGETDLSIAGSIGLLATIFAVGVQMGLGFALSALLVIIGAVIIGFLNSVIIVRLGYSSFIVTVAMMFLTMGVQRAYTNGLTVWIKDDGILQLSTTEVLGIPLFVFIMLVVAIVYYFILYKTKIGFIVRIVGENSAAAEEVGIKIKRIKIGVFIVGTILYGIASIFEPVRVTGAIIYCGQPLLLPAMTACYMGATMIINGRVNVVGTLISSVFLSFVLNVLTQINVEFYIVPIVQGLLLLVAIVLSGIKDRSIKQLSL